eukprot:10419965-Alexandrium_andersonii.AAC.1
MLHLEQSALRARRPPLASAGPVAQGQGPCRCAFGARQERAARARRQPASPAEWPARSVLRILDGFRSRRSGLRRSS